jgi:hypothetical protein
VPRGRPRIHKKKMVSVGGYLPEELADKIRKDAQEAGVPISAVLEEILSEHYKEVDK